MFTSSRSFISGVKFHSPWPISKATRSVSWNRAASNLPFTSTRLRCMAGARDDAAKDVRGSDSSPPRPAALDARRAGRAGGPRGGASPKHFAASEVARSPAPAGAAHWCRCGDRRRDRQAREELAHLEPPGRWRRPRRRKPRRGGAVVRRCRLLPALAQWVGRAAARDASRRLRPRRLPWPKAGQRQPRPLR